MPIKHSIWKVALTPSALSTCRLVSEQYLEDMIAAAPEMLPLFKTPVGQASENPEGVLADKPVARLP